MLKTKRKNTDISYILHGLEKFHSNMIFIEKKTEQFDAIPRNLKIQSYD